MSRCTSVLIHKFLSTWGLEGEGTATEPFDGREDILGGPGPAEGLGMGVAGVDIGGDCGLQLLDGAVSTALDLLFGHRQVGERRVAMAGGSGYPARMTMLAPNRYAGHRFPAEIISHAVWLYFRFPLSLRMVEEMLAARGIVVSHETVRQWALKFGQGFANAIRRRLPQPGDKWHLDEVVITIGGKKHWLWRAVDQHGIVLDVLVQSRRHQAAAKRLLRKLLKRQRRAPRVMVTDKLKSYGAAKQEIAPGVEHRQHKGLNNRAENSHQPTRQRERQMKRFKSPRHAQQLLSAHDQINNLFYLRRHRLTAVHYRAARDQAFATWQEVTGLARAA